MHICCYEYYIQIKSLKFYTITNRKLTLCRSSRTLATYLQKLPYYTDMVEELRIYWIANTLMG